jgi:hypothetical protein
MNAEEKSPCNGVEAPLRNCLNSHPCVPEGECRVVPGHARPARVWPFVPQDGPHRAADHPRGRDTLSALQAMGSVGGIGVFRLFDVGGMIAIAGLALKLVVSAIRNTRNLDVAERLP